MIYRQNTLDDTLDDDDEDDLDYLGWGVNHVFVPALVIAGTTIAAMAASAAGYATIWLWIRAWLLISSVA